MKLEDGDRLWESTGAVVYGPLTLVEANAIRRARNVLARPGAMAASDGVTLLYALRQSAYLAGAETALRVLRSVAVEVIEPELPPIAAELVAPPRWTSDTGSWPLVTLGLLEVEA